MILAHAEGEVVILPKNLFYIWGDSAKTQNFRPTPQTCEKVCKKGLDKFGIYLYNMEYLLHIYAKLCTKR